MRLAAARSQAPAAQSVAVLADRESGCQAECLGDVCPDRQADDQKDSLPACWAVAVADRVPACRAWRRHRLSTALKSWLFMCLLCIFDCLSIFPNRSHDKLISDMSICVACRRRTCHMLGRLARHLRYGRGPFLRPTMKRDGRPASIVTDGLQSYRACDECGWQYGRPDLRSSAQ